MENKAIENENDYEIRVVIDDIALFFTADKKKSGLMNTTTKEIVSSIDSFYTIYDEEGHFFYQTKMLKNTIEDSNNNLYWNETINIYDTLNKKMLVKDAKYYEVHEGYGCLILKNDENYYIFDKILYRQGVNILKYNFSNIETLKYTYLGSKILKVTVNDKKGLYAFGKGIIVPIAYDNIESYYNNEVLIFTKDNKKYFSFYDYFKRNNFNGLTPLSNAFDEINIKSTNVSLHEWMDLMYCKINDLYYVYELQRKKLLLKISCEEIELITTFNRKLIFKIKKDGLYGLISVLDYPINKIEVKTLLLPIYKNITYEKGHSETGYLEDKTVHIFYLENNDSLNLYILNSFTSSNTLITENCTKITYLGYYHFAFYHGLYCDIVESRDSLKTIVKNCLIEEKNNYNNITIIYKKNYKLGLLIITGRNYLIEANYTKVNYLNFGFSILEENDKKKLFHYDKCLTQKYDDIKVANYSAYDYCGPAYAALKRKNLWLIAELKNNGYNNISLEKLNGKLYTEVLFFHDILALRDTEKLAIYNGKLELLATYPQETIIYEVKTSPAYYANTNKYMYVIDDWYYQYKDNKLEEIFLEDAFLNVAAYNSDFGYVVVNDFNKDKYYEKCAKISNFTQSGMDKLLESYLLKRKDLQEKYPHLVRQKKEENHEN